MGVTAINGVAITASLATNAISASKVETVNNDTGAGNLFVPFFGSQTGVQYPGTDSAFTWNPIANTLWVQGNITASNITASTGFFGTASWSRNAITASRAQQLETITNANTATFYPLFVDSANGTTAPELVYSNGTFTFNPGTQELRAGAMNQGTTSNFSNTSDANLTFDAAITQSMYWVASFTATRSLIVSNISQGRMVRVYIRNTNATQRQISFSGSTTTTGHAAINMAISAGGASATTQNIAGSNGTMFVTIENIGGFIVGGVM